MLVIIGAGISGLTAAYYAQKQGMEYVLLELSARPGGYIRTEFQDRFILECGANSLLADEAIFKFINEIGLQPEIVEANAVSKSRYIYKNGKYRKLPNNPLTLLSSPFFNWETKMKIMKEPFNSSRGAEDETIADFFERRFGKEVLDYAVNPFVSGIYAGDPSDLLLKETFPSVAGYESKDGSVLKGLIKNNSGRKKTLNFVNGMQSLGNKLAWHLKNIKYNVKVVDIKKSGYEFDVIVSASGNHLTIPASKIIITTPSFAAANILKNIYPEYSLAFSKIRYVPMVLVHSGYEKRYVGHPLDGFGGLNPKAENQFTAGCIWNSAVFPGRCPDDKVLFTSFVGGAQYKDNILVGKEQILDRVNKELRKNFSITEDHIFQNIFSSEKALPQYDLNIKEARKALPFLKDEGILVCSNWSHGVSVSDCIKSAKETVEKICLLC
ncbi:MAG TPA: protoporphyrinogen oxidase [Cytophagaceae bacterium]|jgi:oxygen-dependent protoporphyrinogen oxidase|nr:protoporphyrinogen oxidase [Cytophagaceae bacterium]